MGKVDIDVFVSLSNSHIRPATCLAADRQFRDRFDGEARAISQLTHPHICKFRPFR